MKLGLIVNPIAGMGGKVGLKGTDNVLQEALNKGAHSVAPARAKEFLKKLEVNLTEVKIDILTCPGIMGKEETEAAGFPAKTLPMKIGSKTSAEDTKLAVKLLIDARVDLMVFVGGDGTAEDILDAQQVYGELPVLGVPAGVKMYSGIFAVSPADASDIVSAFAKKETEIAEFEIMDADEKSVRNDSFAVKLRGYMKGPFLPAQIQGSKQISPETTDEKENQTAIAKFLMEEKQSGATWILGPGTTVKSVAELLGVGKTLLGVDLYKDGNVILDVDEEEIVRQVGSWQNTWIVVSPIGHQGIIFGRGNQQISPEIIRRVGKERVIVLATKSKLQSIDGKILRVDTGDAEVDEMLKGYIRVMTDYREWQLMPVR
ncbi:MAG: ATP-NAD kinase family protein [Candidatus Bathyarchaeia archaeon]|jgi:predicted polyphosphate/ATP-dependent NAD kinase